MSGSVELEIFEQVCMVNCLRRWCASLIPYLSSQGLDRFQVEVVVKMEVVEVLTMDQQVQHVVPLTTHL